jgi:hypothetical protein
MTKRHRKTPDEPGLNELTFAREIMEQAWGFRNDPEWEGYVMPTWFLFSPDNLQLVSTPFDNSPDCKRDAALALAALITEIKTVEWILFVSDAWQRTAAPGDNPFNGPPPSEHIESVEALTIQGWYRDGRGFSLSRPYRADDEGILRPIESEDFLVTTAPEVFTFAPAVEALRAGQ